MEAALNRYKVLEERMMNRKINRVWAEKVAIELKEVQEEPSSSSSPPPQPQSPPHGEWAVPVRKKSERRRLEVVIETESEITPIE
jgi:hypothetical protein